MENKTGAAMNRRSAIPFIAALIASGNAWGAEKTVTLKVENMTCELCPITVQKSLERVPGVSKVAVSFEAKTAVIVFDDAKARPDDLISATTNAGYPSHLAK